MIIILMGVSGSGKSVIGKKLSQYLHWPFYDADDYHSEVNKKKMQKGVALTDQDRLPWLKILADMIIQHVEMQEHMILACSALKKTYRTILTVDPSCQFVYLKGSFTLIKKRMDARNNHFFHSELLQSQFDELEEPQDCLVINIDNTVERIIDMICIKLNL